MATDTEMVALDSNALTYLIDALEAVNGPPTGRLGPTKIALARTFMYLPPDSCFHIVPTVEFEFQKIKDRARLANHTDWVLTHISMVSPRPPEDLVRLRAFELLAYGADVGDCRVLAECELSQIKTLITEDKDFVRTLGGHSRVRIMSAEECWSSLGVKPGASPNKVPHPTNPLARQTWWKT